VGTMAGGRDAGPEDYWHVDDPSTEAQMRKVFLSLDVLSLAALGWPAAVLIV